MRQYYDPNFLKGITPTGYRISNNPTGLLIDIIGKQIDGCLMIFKRNKNVKK